MGARGADGAALEAEGAGGGAVGLAGADIAGVETLELAGAEDGTVVCMVDAALIVEMVGNAIDVPLALALEREAVCKVVELNVYVAVVVIEVVVVEMSIVVLV